VGRTPGPGRALVLQRAIPSCFRRRITNTGTMTRLQTAAASFGRGQYGFARVTNRQGSWLVGGPWARPSALLRSIAAGCEPLRIVEGQRGRGPLNRSELRRIAANRPSAALGPRIRSEPTRTSDPNPARRVSRQAPSRRAGSSRRPRCRISLHEPRPVDLVIQVHGYATAQFGEWVGPTPAGRPSIPGVVGTIQHTPCLGHSRRRKPATEPGPARHGAAATARLPVARGPPYSSTRAPGPSRRLSGVGVVRVGAGRRSSCGFLVSCRYRIEVDCPTSFGELIISREVG